MTRILIIDDEELLRSELRGVLERAGFIVDEADSGRTAHDVLRRNRPDVVITDIVMAEKDGIEVIRELKAETPEIKIIAVSGGGASQNGEYLVWAQKLGADAVAPKPINVGELLSNIADLLGNTSPNPPCK